MSVFVLVLALVAGAALVAHAVTTVLAWRRCRAGRATPAPAIGTPAVSIVRPVHGLEAMDEVTLASTFRLDYPACEVIVCAEHASDPAALYARRLAALHPHVPTRVLAGRSIATSNPKLDNIEKGWRAARHEWIVLADCNVLMPPDYVQRLVAGWRPRTALVCAPPIGAAPATFWAEVECAFLNGYQARWQYAADTLGYGFAHGKNMLWYRPFLAARGGIPALASELAEDAAATKMVRASGFRVRLCDRPFPQPLGERSMRDVWERQLRWAQLRRHTFPLQFAPEVLSTLLVPLIAALAVALALDFDLPATAAAIVAYWLVLEAWLTRAAGWHLSWRSPAAWLVRDVLVVALWLAAWGRESYAWRGKHITVRRRGSRPLADPRA